MFTLLNPHSNIPILLLCEHAENKVPEELDNLGLKDTSILDGHHGFDPPMKEMTERLAEKLRVTAILGNYTRLLVDLNRRPNDKDLIPERYFGQDIPANIGLSKEDYEDRIAIYYTPFHAQVNFQINRLKKAGHTPFIFSLHSFTENPGNNLPDRPWDIGLLYNEYDKAAHHFDDYLTKHHPEIHVGHNEPYDLRDLKTSSVMTHGEEKGLPYLLIELKNENFERGDQTHEQWIEILTDALRAMELDLEFRDAVA